jgi:uncharacterized membrane protein
LRAAPSLHYVCIVSTAAEPVKKRKFSKASLEAADRLLEAVKDKLLKEHGRIDEDDLRRRGYSETTIARLLAR